MGEILTQVINSSMQSSDEVCILNFCRLKDEAAFSCLINRYSESIRRILYTVLQGSEEDMEDVKQEVLLALYKNLDKFTFKSSFSTYLFRMTRNKAIDFIRKKKRHIMILEKSYIHSELIDKNSPESLYIKKENKRNILKVILELSEKDRSIILLKDVENLSIDEIAIIFKKPVGTIKSRLHRARKKAAERILKAGCQQVGCSPMQPKEKYDERLS